MNKKLWKIRSHRIHPDSPFSSARDYYEDSIYIRDAEGRESEITKSWGNFKMRRPECAKLLVILYGDRAREAHLEINYINEVRAKRAADILEPRKHGKSKGRIITSL